VRQAARTGLREMHTKFLLKNFKGRNHWGQYVGFCESGGKRSCCANAENFPIG
jgi:hypothetical protein